MATKKTPKSEVVGFLGVGLDAADEHRRVTQSDHFLIVGGSADTHGQMQETAIRFEEALEQRGKPLRELPVPEVADMLRKARRE